MGATDSGAMDGAVKKIQSNSAVKSGLSGSVGIKGANAPGDVWKVSSALTNNGLMAAPQRHADNTLFTSITKAQENMDSSLKRDGLVNPGGPTESTYTRYVGQGFMKPPTNPLDERKPSPTDSNGYKPLGTGADVLKRERAEEQVETQRARVQRQAERRREREQEEASKRARMAQQATGLNSGLSVSPVAKKEAAKTVAQGLVNLAGKAVSALSRPALSDEAHASNRRTADALGRYKGVGDLPRFTSDAINTNGEKAVHEVADMIGEVHARSPEQAQELLEKTMQGLTPAYRQSLADSVGEFSVPDTQDEPGGSEKNKLVSGMIQGIERARSNQDADKGIQVAESGQIEFDTPTYALLADGGTKPTEPSEPEEPSSPSDPEEPSKPTEPKKPEETDCAKLQRDVENARLEVETDERDVATANEELLKAEAEYVRLEQELLEKLFTAGMSDTTDLRGAPVEKLFKLVKRFNLFMTAKELMDARDRLRRADEQRKALRASLETLRKILEDARNRWAELRDKYARECGG